MKSILVIYGGPRRNRNTEKLLNSFLCGIDFNNANVETIVLNDNKISPCTSCYGCAKTGQCIVEDDMMPIYKKIEDCDVIVIASPIYFANVSALTKAFIDRGQAFWSAKYLAGKRENKGRKKGYFIATAGAAGDELFDCAKQTIKLFFAACNADYCGEALAGNTDKVPVEDNGQVLKQAIETGRNATT